eukprot:4529503-Pleurochrysis_carterae.AAC.1
MAQLTAGVAFPAHALCDSRAAANFVPAGAVLLTSASQPSYLQPRKRSSVLAPSRETLQATLRVHASLRGECNPARARACLLALQIDCAQYEVACREAKINRFPTIRL